MNKFKMTGLVILLMTLAGCTSTNNQSSVVSKSTLSQKSKLGKALADLENTSGKASFSVELLPKLGGEQLRLGDVFDIDLRSSEDAYLHLYLWQTSGKVTALTENMIVKAGVKKSFPPVAAKYQLKANPPTGTNTLLLLATKKPVAGTIYHDFRVLNRPKNIVSTQLGAVATIKTQLSNVSDSDWQSAIRDINVFH